MTTERTKLPHEDRTARQPRSGELHPVILDAVETVNDSIRLFKLRIKNEERGIKVRPRNHFPNQQVVVFSSSYQT
jgi:hypothetical protein